MYVCLRVLDESNKSIFASYNVRNILLIISHINLRDCRVHIFSDSLSRNSHVYSYFEKRCRKKNMHATIPKGNMRYAQYTVPDIVAVEHTFVTVL